MRSISPMENTTSIMLVSVVLLLSSVEQKQMKTKSLARLVYTFARMYFLYTTNSSQHTNFNTYKMPFSMQLTVNSMTK